MGKSPLGTEAQERQHSRRSDRRRLVRESPRLEAHERRGARPRAEPRRASQSGAETWTVFRSKTQGITPGFEIRDESDRRYVIKLDPVDVPELASAAEVIAYQDLLRSRIPRPRELRRPRPPRPVRHTRPGPRWRTAFGDKSELTPFRFRRIDPPRAAASRRQDSRHREQVHRRAFPSAIGATSTPAATTPTTSFPTRTDASSGGCACSRPGSTTTIPGPRTRRTAGSRRTESITCATICSISALLWEADPFESSSRSTAFTTGSSPRW